MKFNSGFPNDSGTGRDPAPNPLFSVITVVDIAEWGTISCRSRVEEPTLTERVLLFLDQRAA